MPGLTHSTNQNRFFGRKPEWLSLPAVWPLQRLKPEQVGTALQIFTEDQPLPPAQRLIVILPDANFDILALAKRIFDLTSPECCQVLLMIQPNGEENEFQARMNLITLAAVIQDSRLVVKTQLVLGQSLDQAARQCSQPGDVFVCFEEHQVGGFFRKRQVSEILARNIQQTIYTLKGTSFELVEPISARLIDFLLLAACMVSLIGFFALEVWIDQISAGTLHTILQILTLFVEVWVIGKIASRSF